MTAPIFSEQIARRRVASLEKGHFKHFEQPSWCTVLSDIGLTDIIQEFVYLSVQPFKERSIVHMGWRHKINLMYQFRCPRKYVPIREDVPSCPQRCDRLLSAPRSRQPPHSRSTPPLYWQGRCFSSIAAENTTNHLALNKHQSAEAATVSGHQPLARLHTMTLFAAPPRALLRPGRGQRRGHCGRSPANHGGRRAAPAGRQAGPRRRAGGMASMPTRVYLGAVL